MNKTLAYFFKRLREPSTMAGLSVLGALAGLPPGTVDLAVQVGAGLAGLAAVLMPEAKSE